MICFSRLAKRTVPVTRLVVSCLSSRVWWLSLKVFESSLSLDNLIYPFYSVMRMLNVLLPLCSNVQARMLYVLHALCGVDVQGSHAHYLSSVQLMHITFPVCSLGLGLQIQNANRRNRQSSKLVSWLKNTGLLLLTVRSV